MTDFSNWHSAHIYSTRHGYSNERKMDEVCPFASHDREANMFTLLYYRDYEQEQHGRTISEDAIEMRGLEMSYES